MTTMLGAYSDPKPADNAIQKMCTKVKPQVEKKTGRNFKDFTALLYREQVVSGKNFAIMVFVGGNEYLDIIVNQDLSGEQKVLEVKKGLDPLRPVISPCESPSPNNPGTTIGAPGDSNMICAGCYTKPRPADADIQKICDKVKPQVEKKTGRNFMDFTALFFQSQVVEGVNYDIMVYAGGNDCLDIIVYQDLSGGYTVTCVERGPNPPKRLLIPGELPTQQAQRL